MTDCSFCRIVKKEIPVQIIYEDSDALAILDIHPRAPGHTMILSKIHTETILGYPEKQGGNLFNSIKKVTAIINEALKPDGFTIGINHGKSAGQAIEHLHIHIIPRWNNDGGSSIHGVVDNRSNSNLEEIKNLILKVKQK
ncbi:MAG: HIT family protein [Patescibacteria group bacterium]|nr:HIT family protein [Patescibacteria group bacterium]